ncbi:molybdate ABC transporter substrate-binding protein [Haliea sp. E17]|uniref:molybdate ABC transporter substrate-binding protein n=1 Tax=Haliea sp. E17 TaxID=3401576 RepID=UPI003AAA2DE9
MSPVSLQFRKYCRLLSRLAPVLLALCYSIPGVAGEARVAVAANFTGAMQAINAAFEQASGHRLQISYGSSGKFYAQIRNGAPYDVFLSADSDKPAALVADGDALEGSAYTYALGTLALWSSAAGAPLDRLKAGDYRRLAIANPRLAPYGAAAMEVLEHLQLLPSASDRVVTGESIAQAYQFVASGNAQLGFIALSQLIEGGNPSAGSWVVPGELHSPIRQVAVLLTRGAGNPAASDFLAFLRSDQARALIESHGYRSAAE